MGKEIKVRIVMRYNSTNGWAALSGGDAILSKGEIGLEYISDNTPPKMKIGNGKLTWDNLSYFEAKLPENFTWGNLRGTTLQTSTTQTQNLNLTKPGFLDVVNIVNLNKNFDILDQYYKTHSDELNQLGQRITDLVKIAEENYPTDEIGKQVLEARVRYDGTTYETLGDTLRAIDGDLQTYKVIVDSVIQDLLVPSSLEINEETGQIYLIDKQGNIIGNAITVKDQELKSKVDLIDSNVKILDTKVRNNTMDIVDIKEAIDNLPSSFPNNLIYENNILYLAVEDEIIESSGVEIVGGGGGGLDTTYVVSLNATETNISKPLGESVILVFNYSSVDREDSSINDGPGSGELIIDGIQRTTFLVSQGENTLDVTKYLVAGNNVLDIKVTNTEGSSKKKQFKIKMLSLSISSSFPKMSFQTSGLLPVSYTVGSETEFTSHFVLTKQMGQPGELYYEPTEIFTETFSRGTTSTAYLSPLPSGSYTLEVYATSGEVKSNSIIFGLIIYTSSDIYPLITMTPQKTDFKQGEIISIPYLVYHPNNTSPTITFNIYSVNSETNEKTKYYSEVIPNIERVPQELTAQQYPTGKIIFEIVCENISNSVNLAVEESDVELELFDEDLLFEFDPIGRTNQNSANTWSYIDKETNEEKFALFSGIDWGILDGWQIKKDAQGNFIEDQTMLRILPGGRVEIPFEPFKNEITNNNVGYTIEIELASQNVTDYEALILNIFDDTVGSERGLKIYSQSTELKSQNNLISAQFKEDERIRLTFTIEPQTLNRLIMIYINGVLCGIKQYERDSFRQENPCPIIIGAEDSGVDIYFIRVYKRALDKDQQLNNFCVDRPSYGEKISSKLRNDILNASAGGDASKMITINSLKGSIPYIIMHCPKLPANKEQDKFKGMKMTFVDPANPTRSFTAEDCTFSVQGTSSAGYPVKNFKIKLGKQGIKYSRSGQMSPGFYFEGIENSQPTKVFCLKADYASSENANNVMLVDYYNETCPYRNEAQKYQVDNGQKETVRHGIHGEPIVLFWQDLSSPAEEIYFQGKYNFNDDKDSENVFGYVDVVPEEIFNIQCWEFTNNNMDLCLFKHNLTEGDNAWFKEVDDEGKMVPAWSNSFERRFPEQEDDVAPDLTAFRRMADWVASTNPARANNEKPLEQAFYYRTLDKSYQKDKKYYQKNADGTFSEATITEKDTAESYSSDIYLDLTLIEKLIEAIQTEIRPIDIIFTKNEDKKTWKVFYLENKEEKILFSTLENLNSYGIIIENNSDILEGFSIKIYLGNDWNSQLYEYHTHDTASYRLAKFKNEFEDYFILRAMAYYYVFTETVLLMDNRAKNMFLVSFDIDSKLIYDEDGKVIGSEKQPAGTYGHWAPTPYDMDSALGINNEGELVYSYHLEDTGEDGKVYTGQESVLWNNFRDCFQSEIAAMYVELRGQHGTTNGSKPFSFEALSQKMNAHQSMWPETIWNIDQQIKYLNPFYASNGEVDHLAMAQGDKRAQRNFWMFNGFKYRDSKYSAGDALENYILFRLNGPGEFNIVPYSHIYARVKFGNALDLKKRALRNQTSVFSTEGISSIYDLETYIYSADRISSIGDLSDFHIGLCNFASASKLKEILLGSEREGYVNTYLKNFRAGASTVLEEVNLSNCVNLSMGINLDQCPNLQIFKAKGSAITDVSFARGARLHTCYLPETISVLSLLDLQYLNAEGLQVEKNKNNKYNFSGIQIENCNQVPFYDLIMNSDPATLKYLRLRGLEWHTILGDENTSEPNFKAFYNKIKQLGGLDENGTALPSDKKAQISGKIYLEENIEVELLREINAIFPELTIVVNGAPQYFLTFTDYKNEVICRYVAAENSTPLDPTKVQIEGLDKTPEQILNILNSKPGEDRTKYIEDSENEIDTLFTFDKWGNLPEKVTSSIVISPVYKEKYLVKFFKEEGLEKVVADMWIERGKDVPDPREESSENIVLKTPSAEFSYIHSGWNYSLLKITGPMNYRPIFSEVRNTYDVYFYTNLNSPIAIQTKIPYGQSALDLDDSLKKYYLNNNPERPSNLHIFEKWNSDILGIKDLTITPQNYQTDPIILYASFIFIGSKNDVSWEQISLIAAAGNQEIDYIDETTGETKKIEPLNIGNTKDINVVLNGIEYTITMELIAIKFDKVSEILPEYNHNSEFATFTFLAKQIPWKRIFNSSEKTYTHPTQNITYSGYTAGGWEKSDIRKWSNEDLFNLIIVENEGLESAIKMVKKISDIGMPVNLLDYKDAQGNLITFEYKTNITDDKIWLPSTTELGTSDSPTIWNTTDEQSSQTGFDSENNLIYFSYPWFSTDDTRIKKLNNEPDFYYTRTHKPNYTYRFNRISPSGKIDYEIMASESSGYVFGFCI